MRDLGATEIIDYQKDDVHQEVMQITQGRGVDYIIDTVGKDSATAALDMLAFNGSIACVAGLPDISNITEFEKGLSIHEVAMGAAYIAQDEAALDDLARIGMEFGALAAKKLIKPMVEEVVTLEDIPDALVRLSMRHVRGKIVARIPQPKD